MQWGREWCTLMTCVVAEFDYMADILIHTGQSILGIPATVGISSPVSSSSRIFSSCDNKVAALIETETIRLKDMLTCLSSRWVQPYIALIVFILFLVFMSPRNVYEMLPTLTVYSSERKSNLQKDMMGKNPNLENHSFALSHCARRHPSSRPPLQILIY